LIDIKKNLSYFLDRKNIVLDIIPVGTPVKIDIHFKLGENQIILDSNYQFSLYKTLNEGIFNIGYNPGFPFVLDILLDKNSNIELNIKIIYLDPPLDLEVYGKNTNFNKYFVLKKVIYG
jgi:hypothetical protein